MPLDPRGDPLENYGQENRAAPKPGRQQLPSFEKTVYDDDRPAPTPVSVPTVIPSHEPSTSAQSASSHEGESGKEEKTLTTEEKNLCPFGDTRWPPPHVSISKPLHLLIENGERALYYHLIYENDAPEVALSWRDPMKSKATAAYAEKGLVVLVSKEGKSKKEIKMEKQKALEEEIPKAKMAIINAKNTRMLKELSTGLRGTIWQLDEEHLHVWRCIEVVQKFHGGVGLGTDRREVFSMFGVGLKSIKGDMLLVSQKIDEAS